MCGCEIAAYVHYPTISRDMRSAVENRVEAFNNSALWARSRLLSGAKFEYYRALTATYGASGRCAATVMVNSTWTRGHVVDVWRPLTCAVVYPPCATETLCAEPCDAKSTDPLVVVSLAQFRPEKNHGLQLEAWARLPTDVRAKARLVVAGAVRPAVSPWRWTRND